MATVQDLFACQKQTSASCPDVVQTMILDKIRSTIQETMEEEHGIRQDRCKGVH